MDSYDNSDEIILGKYFKVPGIVIKGFSRRNGDKTKIRSGLADQFLPTMAGFGFYTQW